MEETNTWKCAHIKQMRHTLNGRYDVMDFPSVTDDK